MRKSNQNAEFLQAVFNGDLEGIRKLLGGGADVNAVASPMLRPMAGQTPLWMVIGLAGTEISSNLKDFRQALTELDPEMPVRKFDEKRKSYFEIAKLLVLAGADTEKQCYGSTPLRQAVCCDDVEMVRFLLDRHANPNAETFSIMSKLTKGKGRRTVPGYLNTVLHEAVQKRQPEIVRALVFARADITKLDHEGKSPADIAGASGFTEILEILRANSMSQ